MAIRDYWIYQRRDVPSPWALYIVKEYDKRAGEAATVIDYTFYHENVGNALKAVSRVGLHCDNSAGYVGAICATIDEYVNVEVDDIAYLTESIERILNDLR